MDLTYAVRGAAFANPNNMEKSRTQHRILIQLLSGTDSWAQAQICVDHIQIAKDQYPAAIGGRSRRAGGSAPDRRPGTALSASGENLEGSLGFQRAAKPVTRSSAPGLYTLMAGLVRACLGHPIGSAAFFDRGRAHNVAMATEIVI
jgi:hypothetical protein